MTDTPAIYLGGPIQHSDDDGKTWRERVVDRYGSAFEFHDPWEKYPDGVSNGEILDPDSEYHWEDAEIMAGDRHQIRKSDGILIKYDGEKTWGTPREMEYVSRWGRGPDIPVAIATTIERPSPWMHDAIAIESNIDAAIAILSKEITDA